jgi:hypothetical protein
MSTPPVAILHHGQNSEGLNMTITEFLDMTSQKILDMWSSEDSMVSSKNNMMS